MTTLMLYVLAGIWLASAFLSDGDKNGTASVIASIYIIGAAITERLDKLVKKAHTDER
jgi:hypothetical protein